MKKILLSLIALAWLSCDSHAPLSSSPEGTSATSAKLTISGNKAGGSPYRPASASRVARTADPGGLTVSAVPVGGRSDRQPTLSTGEIAELIGVEWSLNLFGTVGEEITLLPGSEISMQFLPDNRIEGSSGCNSYFATYGADPAGNLLISDLVFTERACLSPEGVMDQETRYLQALGSAAAFTLEGERLILFYDSRLGALHFAVPQKTTPSFEVADLIDRMWILESFETVEGDIASSSLALPDVEVVIDFTDDGRLMGAGGCNSYTGRYTARENGALEFSQLGFTDMACLSPEGAMAQEDRYFDALVDVSSFEILDHRLRLYHGDGPSVLNFTTQEE